MLFDGGRNKSFDIERFKSIKGDFSDEGNEDIFGSWVGFCLIPRVTHKGSGEGGRRHTWWVQQFCDIFGKRGDAWHMILGDNPTGHGFVLRDLVLIELSGHAPPSLQLGMGGGDGRAGGSHNFEVKIKTV